VPCQAWSVAVASSYLNHWAERMAGKNAYPSLRILLWSMREYHGDEGNAFSSSKNDVIEV
jgi:hypothetical protein